MTQLTETHGTITQTNALRNTPKVPSRMPVAMRRRRCAEHQRDVESGDLETISAQRSIWQRCHIGVSLRGELAYLRHALTLH